MSDDPGERQSLSLKRAVLILLGVLFIGAWNVVHLAWGSMSLMANLMANDSGAASQAAHLGLIIGMLGGTALSGIAGIPAGLAFFWEGKRKRLLMAFGGLFLTGVACQLVAFRLYFH